MNKLTVEDLKITLQMQLEEVDRRIQSGRQVAFAIPSLAEPYFGVTFGAFLGTPR